MSLDECISVFYNSMVDKYVNKRECVYFWMERYSEKQLDI